MQKAFDNISGAAAMLGLTVSAINLGRRLAWPAVVTETWIKAS